jgi:hypothetical protein
MTDAPLDQMAGAIAPLRPFADEVVVAVDARVGTDLAAAHTAFADRVVRVPYVPPMERSLAWLHAQCSCDWILRIDSDEIASPAFAVRLPELTGSRDVTHYWIRGGGSSPTGSRISPNGPGSLTTNSASCVTNRHCFAFRGSSIPPSRALAPLDI